LLLWQVGALVGFAVGGPVVALVGAALASYSITANNDVGEATRSVGGAGVVVVIIN
jgi:purine-cytosine permease-like protein